MKDKINFKVVILSYLLFAFFSYFTVVRLERLETSKDYEVYNEKMAYNVN